LIGTLTSLIYIPIGIFFGIVAGYYKKRVDDVIQYLYSTLASIPASCCSSRCCSCWAKACCKSPSRSASPLGGLCRLLRGETLRQSERAYCEAARSLGQSNINIIFRHILRT